MGFVNSIKEYIHTDKHPANGYQNNPLEQIGVALYAPLGKVVKLYEEQEGCSLAKVALAVAGVFTLAIALIGALFKKIGECFNNSIKNKAAVANSPLESSLEELAKRAGPEVESSISERGEDLIAKMHGKMELFRSFDTEINNLKGHLSPTDWQAIDLEKTSNNFFKLLEGSFELIKGNSKMSLATVGMLISVIDESQKGLILDLYDIEDRDEQWLDCINQMGDALPEIIGFEMSILELYYPEIRGVVEEHSFDVYQCLMQLTKISAQHGDSSSYLLEVDPAVQRYATALLQLPDVVEFFQSFSKFHNHLSWEFHNPATT